MADTKNCVLSWVAILLHVLICVASGFCFIFSLLLTMFSDQCLPNLVNLRGNGIKSQNGFPQVCEAVVYGLGVVSGVSLISALTAWCCVKRPLLACTSFMLTFCMGAFAIFGGTTFTVHYMLWCDSISQTVPSYYHATCAKATDYYDRNHDTRNMTAFKHQMEIQQAVTWSLFPLTLMVAVVYAIAMHLNSRGSNPEEYVDDSVDEQNPRGFFKYLLSLPHHAIVRQDSAEERRPFIAQTQG